MKNLQKLVTLLLTIAVGAVACQKIDNEGDELSDLGNGTVLYASTLSDDITKISFIDNDSQGITIEWEEDDTFTLYNSTTGDYVGDFICTDITSGAFINEDIKLSDGTTYTAIYPASSELTLTDAVARDLTSLQDGDAIANLDDACYMLKEFIYSKDNLNFTFEHQMSIVTFKFESESRPAKLVFLNGDETYTVIYTDIKPDKNNIYTSHIMI